MHVSYDTSIFNLVLLGVHVFMQLVAAVLILIKHNIPNRRAWCFIGLFFMASAIGSFFEILMIANSSFILDTYKLLNPSIIIPGFYIFFLLFCYEIEIMRPGWLDWKRILALITPNLILVCAVLYHTNTADVGNVYSLSRLIKLINEPEIITRIMYLALFIPYCVALFAMRCQWKSKNQQNYIDLLLLLTTLLCISYIFSRGLQIYAGYIAHEIFYTAATVLIIYNEHKERLNIPMETVRSYYHTSHQQRTTTQLTIEIVANNLRQLMEKPEIWQDPEMNSERLTQLASTNRTYIQEAAKLMGFANPTDMIHRRRIDYICQQLREDPNTVIQDLFYDAGYRSRNTAWRRFVSIVGCTPTEFIEKNTTPPQDKIR